MCDATNVVFLSKTCNERSLTHLLPFPKVKNSTLFLIKIHRHTSSALISSPQSYLSFLLSPSLSLSLPTFTHIVCSLKRSFTFFPSPLPHPPSLPPPPPLLFSLFPRRPMGPLHWSEHALHRMAHVIMASPSPLRGNRL